MKNRLRFFAVPILVLVLCVTMCIPAFAAKPTADDVGLLMIGTSTDDLQPYTAVCIKEEDGNYIYSAMRPISQQVGLYCSIVGKETAEVVNEIYVTEEYEEWQGGIYRGSLGEAQDYASQADVFPEMGSVTKNDTVYFTYINVDDDDFKVGKSTVKSISKGVLTTKDGLEEELSDKEFVVVFNEKSEVVALCKNGTAYTLNSKNTFNILIPISAAAAVIVLIVVVLLVVKKKKPVRQNTVVEDYKSETTLDDGYDNRTVLNGMDDGQQTQLHNAGSCKLIGHGGVMNGHTYQVGPGGATIGRRGGNTIPYPDDTLGVSRQHLKIFWDNNGQLMLMDVGSRNGTYLEHMGKLTPMVPVPLSDGDIFYVGERKNAFQVSFR